MVICVGVVRVRYDIHLNIQRYTARELAHLSSIAQALKICADELSPIAHALKTCADELPPIAQALKTCADELPPIAQAGGGRASLCSSYSSLVSYPRKELARATVS